jgi:hypothetical protein
LTVALGDKKRGIAWDGDSKTPDSLGVAVGELISLADDVAKDRGK